VRQGSRLGHLVLTQHAADRLDPEPGFMTGDEPHECVCGRPDSAARKAGAVLRIRIPASISRLCRRARSLSGVGDTCFHGQCFHGRRLGDAIAGEEKARSDHCGDEGAAPPDGVG
jgi:hypothetical protein